MTIEQTDMIDLIGVDQSTDEVVLTITDPLVWENDSREHLYLLQEKINTYVGFIESEDFFREFPDAKGREIVINIVGKHSLTDEAIQFITQAFEILQPRGIGLKHELIQLH